MSKCHIEILTNIIGIIRIGDDKFNHGDKYHWVSSLIKIDENTVEISGTLFSPSREDWLEICKEINNLGYKFILITRIKKNKKILKLFSSETGIKIK